jgi:hypothetical protein
MANDSNDNVVILIMCMWNMKNNRKAMAIMKKWK